MTGKFTWRITKYNPKYRSEKGFYLRKEWTSISEIGSLNNDNIPLTISGYTSIEDKYIKAILYIMSCLDVQRLSIVGLEKWEDKLNINDFPSLYSDEMIDLYSQITNDTWLEKDQISDICRLVLREKVWCKLECDSKMYVHFGHDFYMFIGSELMCKDAIDNIEKTGLFVEDFISPISNED